jgi:signal transduction histidine kinase
VVARAGTGPSPDRTFLLETVLPTLSATLERDELLSRGSASQQEVLAATTRRLARLRFDLHDGPQQDVMMLAEDLRFFRDQLASATAQTSSRDRILGRVDDLQARLVALDGDLRRISASLQSPFLQPHSLRNAIKQLTEAFTARTAVKPEVKLRGEFTHLTDSQQIALLALIREALANVREHSNAKHVSVSLNVGAKGVVATVSDDGQGFDPEATLVKAAREGHLGLVGMHERVRLLGGHTQIDSQPGGPTVISVRLPPVAADTAALEADAAVLD